MVVPHCSPSYLLQFAYTVLKHGHVALNLLGREVARAKRVHQLLMAQLAEQSANPVCVRGGNVLTDPVHLLVLHMGHGGESHTPDQYVRGRGRSGKINRHSVVAYLELGPLIAAYVAFGTAHRKLNSVGAERSAQVADQEELLMVPVLMNRVIGVSEVPIVQHRHHHAQAIELTGPEKWIFFPAPGANFFLAARLARESRVEDHGSSMFSTLYLETANLRLGEHIDVIDEVADGPQQPRSHHLRP